MIGRSLLFILILFLSCYISFGQNRWSRIYYDEVDAMGINFINSYDKGFLLVGKHGHNYVNYNWLIKTDINGEILWEKTLGDPFSTIMIADMAYNQNGDFYLVGSTGYYNSAYYDPMIMKLSACGEKQWCKVFIEEGINFSYAVVVLPDGGCVITLSYMGVNLQTDRICLAEFSIEGDLIWKQCYNSVDSSIYNEEGLFLMIMPDGGFLISGYCDYVDPNPPHYWWDKPYYIKTDSLGNFEWETVVHNEISDKGGLAVSSTISPDNQYIYSSIRNYHHNSNTSCPALLKMNLQGEVVGIYDIIEGYTHGQLSFATFLNDSILAASAGWGNSDWDFKTKAVTIDTLGNLLNSYVLMNDIYTSILQVTYDGKLAYFTNTEQNGQFDVYLQKLNQNLEDDTLYTFPFQYDTLCPYPIASDTIVQDDCDLIVGIEEEDEEMGRDGDGERMELFPNPASDRINCRLSVVDCRYSIFIYDMFGRKQEEIQIPKGQKEIQIDVSDYPQGIYIAVLRSEREILAREKFVVN